MKEKYELTSETLNFCGIKLHRIKAMRSFAGVSQGVLGGWIEGEENLAHEGNCWVSGSARVQSDRDWCSFTSFGSEGRTTTAYTTEKGVEIVCGCFDGHLAAFRDKVKDTHGDSQLGKEYSLMADLIGLRISKKQVEYLESPHFEKETA